MMRSIVLGMTVVLSVLLGRFVGAGPPDPTFTVKFKGSNKVRGLDDPRLLFDITNRGEERTVDCTLTVLIDQLLWETEDVHQERSGQYISLLLQNLVYGRM